MSVANFLRKGFVHPDRLPQTDDIFHEGTIGFHMRSRAFSQPLRLQRYMDFMKA